jgi:hypothetical protein
MKKVIYTTVNYTNIKDSRHEVMTKALGKVQNDFDVHQIISNKSYRGVEGDYLKLCLLVSEKDTPKPKAPSMRLKHLLSRLITTSRIVIVDDTHRANKIGYLLLYIGEVNEVKRDTLDFKYLDYAVTKITVLPTEQIVILLDEAK